jgi:hypothetical protein
MIRPGLSENSTYIESVMEHQFLYLVLSHLWEKHGLVAEVLRADVDNSGYDLLIETKGVVRFIQLKSHSSDKKPGNKSIHLSLAAKTNPCMIILDYAPKTLAVEKYWWWDGTAFSPEGRAHAKKSKRNSESKRDDRKNHVIVKASEFKRVADMAQLVRLLFSV